MSPWFFCVAIDEGGEGGFTNAADACECDGSDAGLGQPVIDFLDDLFALLDGFGVGWWRQADDATKGGGSRRS